MFRKFAKDLYYFGLSAFHADQARIRSLAQGNNVVVLNLHRVSPIENAFWPPMHPDVFEELLIFLRDYFTVCRFDQLLSASNERPLAVISFDDGYYDFLQHVLPLLDEFGMQANMNIIPECAETGMPIWNVRLYDFLNAAPRNLIKEIDLPGFDFELIDDSRAAKLKFGLKISSFLKKRPRLEREGLCRSIEHVIAKTAFELTRMMNADEIKHISEKTEIGAHSFSHDSMGFENNEFFERDFAKCQEYFLEKLDIPLSIYAFPNGSYRAEQIDFLRRSGIEHILLVDEKFADKRSDVVPRLTIYGESKNEVRMKALGF